MIIIKSRKLLLTGMIGLTLFGTVITGAASNLLPVRASASNKSNKSVVKRATMKFYRMPYTDDTYQYVDYQSFNLKAKEGQTVIVKAPKLKNYNFTLANVKFKLENGKFKQIYKSNDKFNKGIKFYPSYDNTPDLVNKSKLTTPIKTNVKNAKFSKIKETKVKILGSEHKVYNVKYYSSINELPQN
ncbi:hypothetical protein [Apilactobacillus ozensis]|uniref:hypothetical protein n=1 Tax=Apilactobacillus ozensis TaxID=866801 RepID=UPI00200B10A4|nr:hypothetical protein [Apilactobacillus ozensis]MCK8607211.1 hypothetical protein [Apilactobacillus ozensis]